MNELDTMQTTALENAQAQQKPLATNETASQVLAAQVKATIESRFIVAKRMPRDMDIVREKLIKQCKRPYACETFIYNKPIGNSKIEGASIRFAEAAICCMGNIAIENNAIYDDENKKIIRVMAIDIEANTSYFLDVEVEKTVERKMVKKGDVVLSKRYNSYNQIVYTLRAREDELLIKQNAMISKAIRTLALRLVPGDIIDECMDIIKDTLKKKDKENPETAKRKMFDAFGSVGVSVEDLKTYLGHEGNILSPAELQDLRGIYQSIKDGEITWRTIIDNMEVKPPTKNKEKELFKKEEKAPVENAKETQEEPETNEEHIMLSDLQMQIVEKIGEENVNYFEQYLAERKTLKKDQNISNLSDMQCQSILSNIEPFIAKIAEIRDSQKQ